MFQYFINNFGLAICYNNIYGSNNRIYNSPYCCGSFILFASIGFVLYLIQKNINNLYTKFIIWFIIACIWTGCVLYDKYYGYVDDKEGNQKTCRIFFWHAANFLLGLFSGLVLAK